MPDRSRAQRNARVGGRLAGALTLAALTLAACGGSSAAPATSTTTGPAPSTTTGAATATTTAQTTTTSGRRPRRHGAAAAASATSTATPASTTTTPASTTASTTTTTKATTPRAATTAGSSSATTSATRTTPAAPAATAAATPVQCLRRSGLRHIHRVEHGLWAASRLPTPLGDVNAMVFVDGPYAGRHAAAASAQSLQGTEYADPAGRYVASATLRSRLSAAVAKVAACLGGGHAKPQRSRSKTYSF
jgi:hypothetical protein